MRIISIAERTHEANITRLVQEFGFRKERRIREIYKVKREIMEDNSTSIDFLPIITYKRVREAMMK